VLLLDEPTNHLDAESVAWLEHHLQKYEGTIIAVTHDPFDMRSGSALNPFGLPALSEFNCPKSL
jgi:ABC-type transport system involved in cytochrome bd biosynthesis fused ATPase/permease subunit